MLRNPNHASRRTGDLRVGRVSRPGAIYFITFCTADRVPDLADETPRAASRRACTALETAGDAEVLAATVMPDHVHLLVRLGARLALDRVVAKRRAAVKRENPRLAWQGSFFEHRLREGGRPKATHGISS